ncbi:MBL fold metallo-hydrolase [Pseudomonas sp. EpS/L25]|uniref:MBL fold metallo-hydrolase n=1 Tax=Pseudomonas sp. EpS/L25 TaxID=1749078 RepID=UPI00074439CF|nr:MBL fold metallo-hydrolase [Pseudomonas sp. EpS/L25]KUM44658.1 MBL fold metallo-hydrolase [Pseudomonas sp. EpS/L25]
MDILFLGTSAGVPTRRRNVSAVALIEDQGKGWFLIDCGEATQHQLLRTPLSAADLRAICITHIHGDHCYGLPGLLASAAMTGRSQPLALVAPRAVQAWLGATQALTALHLPFEVRFHALEDFTGLALGAWDIDAFALSHRVPSHAFRFRETRRPQRLDPAALATAGVPRGPLWGRLQAGEDVLHEGRLLRSADFLQAAYAERRLVVAGDNDRPELLVEACRGAQLLVHEATYAQAHIDKTGESWGHSSAAGIARFAQAQQLPALLLTHFSPRYQADPARSPSIQELGEEAAAHYSGELHLAEDFSRFRLDRQGRLKALDQSGGEGRREHH